MAVIAVNSPPVNTITAAVRQGLFAALADIRARPGIKAVVLFCEGSTFFSGADIGEFAGPPKEAEFRDLFRQLEQLPVPVVAAMHGTAMGGGLEIALACHYRVAVGRSSLRSSRGHAWGSFPEPGGTQRMPRLIGVEKTLELILAAQAGRCRHRRSLKASSMRQVQGDLRDGAVAYARALVRSGAGARRTSERSVDPATATPAIIERLTAQAKSQYPNREAALTAIEAVSAAASMPLRGRPLV